MKASILACVVSISLILGGTACSAQGSQLVQLEKVFKSRNLSGTIGIHFNSGGIAGTTVEDCSPGWQSVLTSTTSDENGRFLFARSKVKLHYLRLIAPGLNITLVKVRITRWSRQKALYLEMTPGT